MKRLLVILMLISAVFAYAQQEITLVDEMFEAGEFRDIVICGNYLLTPNIKGLAIYDISNPSSPVHINTINTPGRAENLVAKDNYLYLFDVGNGIILFDITDPSSPSILDTFHFYNGMYLYYPHHTVEIYGNMLYYPDYVNYNAYLKVLDITNPLSPVPRDSIQISNYSYDLQVNYPYCYMTDNTQSIYILNLSDPDSICVVDTISLGGRGYGMVTVDNYLYVGTDYSYGVEVFDITNPVSPDSAGYFLDEWYAYYSLVEENSVLYGYRHGGRLAIFDISNPTEIDTVGLAPFSYGGGGGCMFGEDTLLAMTASRSTASGNYYGMGIMGISDPISPNNLSYTITDKGPIQFVKTTGNNLIMANPGEIYCYGIQNPASPYLLSDYNPSPCNVYKLAVDSNYVYYASSWHYSLGALSLPGLSPAGSFSTQQYLFDIVASNGYVYGVRDTLRVFQVIDDSLQQLGVYQDCVNTIHLFVRDTLLFFYDYDSALFKILNVSNPSSPTLAGGLNPEKNLWYSPILVDGDYGYFLYGDSLLVYHFGSNFSSMDFVGSLFLDNYVEGGDIAVQDTFMYIAGNEYLTILKTTTPDSPILVDRYNTSGIPEGVAPYGDYVYVADNTSLGIYHFQVTGIEEEPAGGEGVINLAVTPNPAMEFFTISYSIPRKSRVKVGIYDLTGRLVRSFPINQSTNQLINHIIWKGEDDRGKKVSRGVYFCLVETQHSITSRKVVLLK
ncbi:hypothetical protein CH333_08875 [candidate division WOR-3 bacterium JGI_Cruoil_03_44_89]|uniref:Secretion system C-terminal sorting domain-containing protein n=1 Tax=candidate division WOR-3 bacterium JGI_Cruoil_03_44_89 TaxID=1973748 RepID=A0A235BQ71_UNCW3|nr:MAG: hypothetical protein CH333_08875 [candidate division WOR-3 bacterium JGI_Cruoil_03_44_89]